MKSKILTLFLCITYLGTLSQTTIYEAEDALLFGSLSVGNTFEGYSGTGYVGGFAQDGDKILFTVHVPETGVYELKVGYMSKFGYKENYLIINGVQQGNPLKFPGSTVFTETTYGPITLMGGANTIEILKWWGFCWVDYITVGGIGPVGIIHFEPEKPVVNEPFTISASQSYHPNNNEIISYEWIVNYEDEYSLPEFLYTFEETGRYSIQLLLTDENGNQTRSAKNVLVITGIPYASFGYLPQMPKPGDEITFNASTSVDFNGDWLDYAWDFGDNTQATGQIVTHTYWQQGNYEVKLTVTDADNNTASTTSYLFVYPEETYIRGLQMVNNTVGLYEKAEMIFSINNTYSNVFDPDEVKVDAIIETPGGDTQVFPAFYFIKSYYDDFRWLPDTTYQYWKLRYSPHEIGQHNISIQVSDATGTHLSETVSFMAVESDTKGFIHLDANDPNFYRHETGQPFFPVGIHMQHNEDQLKHPRWQLEKMQENNANLVRMWIVGNTQLEWTGGRFKGLGYYSPESAMLIDTLLELYREHDVYMQLVFNWHGQFSTNVNPNWAGNPYNINYGGFLSHPREYFNNQQAFDQAKKKFRYIIARWGYSPNVFAWEFFNEVNFCGTFLQEPESFHHDVANYHRVMSSYVKSIDVFNHIQTTSSDSRQLKLMDDTDLDNLNYHIYANNLLGAIRSYAEGLRNDVTKPLLLGEFGTPTEKDLLRRVYWQGLFIKVPSIYWYIETLIKEDWWDAFSGIGTFTQNADFAAEGVRIDTLHHSGEHEGLILHALKGNQSAYGYFYHPDNITATEKTTVEIPDLDYGWYQLTIMDPETAQILYNDSIAVIKQVTKLIFSPFNKELAFSLRFSSPYNDPIAIAGIDQRIPFPDTVHIDGSNSYDPMGESITFFWELLSKPDESHIHITDPHAQDFYLSPDKPGIYRFLLSIETPSAQSLPDTLSVLSSQRPVAIIQNRVMEVLPGRFSQPNGTESYDHEGEPLTFLWKIISQPQGSSPSLFKADEPVAAFRSSQLGDYQLSLEVSDGISWSVPDTVLIKVVDELTNTWENTITHAASNVYPNPFSENLHITWTGNQPRKVVIDVTGINGARATLFEGVSQAGKNQIVISPNKLGTYNGLMVIRIITPEKTFIHKVFKDGGK